VKHFFVFGHVVIDQFAIIRLKVINRSEKAQGPLRDTGLVDHSQDWDLIFDLSLVRNAKCDPFDLSFFPKSFSLRKLFELCLLKRPCLFFLFGFITQLYFPKGFLNKVYDLLVTLHYEPEGRELARTVADH